MKTYLASAALAFVILLPSAALAGDCPTCDTSADCNGNFCVNWASSPGCGALTQICCPGQGCALDNGCPSCFLDGNCTIVDGPDTCAQASGGGGAGGAPGVGGGGGSPPNGSGGAGGSAANGGAAQGGASQGGNGTGGSGPSGSGGTAGANGDGEGSDGGCDCAVVGPPPTGLGAMLAAAGLLLAAGRRKRAR